MDNKEKVSVLVEMGFTVDEAISLAKGNYRTVPDPEQKTEPVPETKTEPKTDPKQEQPKTQPEPEQKTDSEPWERIEKALATLTQSVIQSNINNKQQPKQMTAQDVLGLMLEPGKPAERSK